jgi:transposase-like protein
VKTGNNLSSQQKAGLERIAAIDSIHGQRARALLALDSGATQTAAAAETGLTVSTVRYWRNKFMEQGFGIFPESLIVDAEPGASEPKRKKKPKSGKKKSKNKGGKKKTGKQGKKKKKKK